MKNKYVSFAFFTTFGIKAVDKLTGDINVTFGGKNYKIPEIKAEFKDICPNDITKAIDKEIQKTIPLFFIDDCFISEFKVNNTDSNIYSVKYNENDKIDIVLKKKLKVKEIKFKDSNFKQYLLQDLTYDVKRNIEENNDFSYKTIFNALKSIGGLFKTGKFGIKLNNFEDTNEKLYDGADKLNEGDEITVILDEKKIEENAFLKFIFEYDEDIFDLKEINSQFSKILKPGITIKELVPTYLIPKEFDIYKNDDNTPIKSSSTDPIPADLKYFRIKLDKNNVEEVLLKKDKKVQLSKKGCKIVNEDVLKSIEVTVKKSYENNLLDQLKESSFINENIDKTMISIKNQDTSDTKTYTLDDPKLPDRIIVDLTPEALITNQVKIVFSIANVEKDGRKLKTEFKNNFSNENDFFLAYGDNKSVLINLITGIIPGITEADIKLNGQSLQENIKEGGEISIPVEKIPDGNFQEVTKPEEEQKQNTDNKDNNGNGNNNGDNNGDNNKKNDGYCGSNKKN